MHPAKDGTQQGEYERTIKLQDPPWYIPSQERESEAQRGEETYLESHSRVVDKA